MRLQKHQRETLERLGKEWEPLAYTGGTHLRVRHAPTGAMITIPSSPGSQRNLAHVERAARAAIRKALERKT